MTGESGATGAGLDTRSPYLVIWAVQQTLLRASDDLKTEDDVARAIYAGMDPESPSYAASIARARHSVFYHQLQRSYETGRRHVRPELRDGFVAACGKTLLDALFKESVYLVLQIALARPGTFQRTISENVLATLYRLAGDKYVFEAATEETEIVVRMAYRDLEAIGEYLRSHDVEPATAFRNSFELISGALAHLTSKIVAGYDADRFRVESESFAGSIHLPIAEDDDFAYEALIPDLVGYIGELKSRREKAVKVDAIESDLIIASDLMRETWDRLRRASRSDEIVLLRGESGTGKSFLASKIHELSPRANRPFVEVGLTADIGTDDRIQSDLFGHERGAYTGAREQKLGLFSLADGGTIFLDEVGDASPELQARLLRVLESKTFKRLGGTADIRVDVRIIAATNRDLERLVQEKAFRQDLYYRLNVIRIDLPPLREHREDIVPLAHFLLNRAGSDGGAKELEQGLPERLKRHDWPGNIRELDHALRAAAALAEGDVIRAADLPPSVRTDAAAGPTTTVAMPAAGGASRPLIDEEGLRELIRQTAPPRAGEVTYASPVHVEYAKRTWLRTLIEECGGDLGAIASYWDRSSEKTLRNLIRTYELTDLLAVARSRARG